MIGDKVISLEDGREKKKERQKLYREALVKLLVGPPPKRDDSKDRIRVVIPYNPEDADEAENFNQGFSAGRAGEGYSPKSRSDSRGPKSPGAGYGCGYLNGIIWRELSKDGVGWVVDWVRFDRALRSSSDEVFDDEKRKMPRGHPALSSHRVRDVCIGLDMLFLTKCHETTGAIIAEILKRYPIEERKAMDVWKRDDSDYTAWVEPVQRPTATK